MNEIDMPPDVVYFYPKAVAGDDNMSDNQVIKPRDRMPHEDDDTARIQDAINEAAEINGDIGIPTGTYVIGKQLLLLMLFT